MRRLLRRINDWTSAQGAALSISAIHSSRSKADRAIRAENFRLRFIDLKPNLLVTTSTLPNRPDDPEPRFVLDLAIGLSRHFEVCVLAPRNPGARPIDEFGGVEIRRYPYAPLRSWETLTYPGASLERLRQRPGPLGIGAAACWPVSIARRDASWPSGILLACTPIGWCPRPPSSRSRRQAGRKRPISPSPMAPTFTR